MEKITGNESAMPAVTTEVIDMRVIEQEVKRYHPGLTIRQHFAAMAMQGLLSNSEITEKTYYNDETDFYNSYAGSAVGMADALIVELNKDKK